MKKFLLLFFFLPFIASAQAHIELRNTTNGTIVNIADNTKVKAVANGHTFHGKLHLIDTQSVYIGKSVVKLDDVTSIKANSTAKAVVGSVTRTAELLTGGTTLDKSQKAHSRSDWAYRIIL